MEIKETATVNYNGDPKDFSIISNSTDTIEYKEATTVKGLIYAPYAKVEIKENSSIYGIIWGREVEINEGTAFCFDTSLKGKFAAGGISLASWREDGI